jgi:hypothetical protein
MKRRLMLHTSHLLMQHRCQGNMACSTLPVTPCRCCLPAHPQWRAFSNQHIPPTPARQFVDGDLIEQFLDLK